MVLTGRDAVLLLALGTAFLRAGAPWQENEDSTVARRSCKTSRRLRLREANISSTFESPSRSDPWIAVTSTFHNRGVRAEAGKVYGLMAMNTIDAAQAMVNLEGVVAAVKGQEEVQETKFAKALATLKALARKEGTWAKRTRFIFGALTSCLAPPRKKRSRSVNAAGLNRSDE
jgi:hypothetical protein